MTLTSPPPLPLSRHAFPMMCSRQCASSSKFQAQPFHVLSWISRGWRWLKRLHSVVFSNKHPFWNASTGRMWSMAELVKVIGKSGCWSFHVLRFCSKCTYTYACASVIARLLVRYVGPCRHRSIVLLLFLQKQNLCQQARSRFVVPLSWCSHRGTGGSTASF